LYRALDAIEESKVSLEQHLYGHLLESGFPFSWVIFEGNVGESPTMVKQVKKLKRRFNLQTTLFVFDRGFLSEKNLKFIQNEGCEYLTGLDKPQVALLIDVYASDLREGLRLIDLQLGLKNTIAG
jgi:hypothetical protein